MQLYVTDHSPFARIARIVRRERGLEGQVDEVTAVTRTPNSSYYRINPSGRVPYLTVGNGDGVEGSQPVCYFLDHLDGAPKMDAPAGDAGLAHRRLEEYARSVMDGVSVWLRELRRSPDDRSLVTIEHERQRFGRLIDFWENEIGHPFMQARQLNMPQLTLACALLLEEWYPGLFWRSSHPRLAAWVDTYAVRPSFVATRPLEKIKV